jgi:hypothetical protein
MKTHAIFIARLILILIFNLVLYCVGNAQYRVTPVSPTGDTGRAISPKLSVNARITVPGLFTPNGDGFNDVLKPMLTGVHDFILTIYDDEGQLKAILYQPEHVWEGDNAAAGQYHWRLIWTDVLGNEHSDFGRILLNR